MQRRTCIVLSVSQRLDTLLRQGPGTFSFVCCWVIPPTHAKAYV